MAAATPSLTTELRRLRPSLSLDVSGGDNLDDDGIAHGSSNSSSTIEDSIIVAVRMRPLGRNERASSDDDELASRWELSDIALVEESAVSRRAYTFDRVHSPASSNADVYDACAKRVVSMALGGVNGCVMAYGPTGSGKTHTMLGTDSDPGVVPRAVHDIFEHAEREAASGSSEFLIRVSYMEVYNEEVNDLLAEPPGGASSDAVGDGGHSTGHAGGGRGRSSTAAGWSSSFSASTNGGGDGSYGRNLRILRDDPLKGALIEGLSEHIVVDRVSTLNLIARGEAARHYGSTRINDASSRSHTIFRMVLESRRPPTSNSNTTTTTATAVGAGTGTVTTDAQVGQHVDIGSGTDDTGQQQQTDKGGGPVQLSILNLVDLAGSERSDAAGTHGSRLKEGGHINKSLSALAMVISKLADIARRAKLSTSSSGGGGGSHHDTHLLPLTSTSEGHGAASASTPNSRGTSVNFNFGSGVPPPTPNFNLGSAAARGRALQRQRTAGRSSSNALTAAASGAVATTPPRASSGRMGAASTAAGRRSRSLFDVEAASAAPDTELQLQRPSDPSSTSADLHHHPTNFNLKQSSEFVPYRNSKLTRLLRQSLGGNSLTSVLCTVSPAPGARDDTVSHSCN